MRAPRFGDIIFPAAALLLLAAMGVAIPLVERWIVMPRIAPLLDEGALTDAQRVAISHVTDLGKLMISWCVALLGAIAVSARSVLGLKGLYQWVSAIGLGMSFLACIVSIWLGMVVMDLVVLSLTLEQSPLKNGTLHLCRRWQYFSFIFALVFFVLSWLNTAVRSAEEMRTAKPEGAKA